MRRRFGVDVVLAVVLPLACALALVVLGPERTQPTGGEPVEAPLTSASVACPAPLAGTGTDSLGVSTLGSAADVRGEVQVGGAQVRVRSGRVAQAPVTGEPAVVTGAGELAPGLVAGRSQTAPLAATDCAPPVADQWFTGIGAGPTHNSVVELVNPDAGAAIADLTVHSPDGVLDVPALRGVSVPGGTATRLDLGQIVPRRGELAIQVHTSRGRLVAHVVDAYDELGSGIRAEDWLPAQAEPASTLVLLGLVRGAGERTLVLANPGADEVRAEIRVVAPDAVFAPAGVEPVRVAPGATEAVPLDDVLAQAAEDGATGLLVESTGPVTAGLRQVVAGDLSLLGAAPSLEGAAAAVVPPGVKRLLLGGAGAAGAATVTAYAGNGRALAEQRVELAPDRGADVALPDQTELVVVTPEGTSVRAALLLTGTGAAVVPLRELVLTELLPDVRPGVP